jgi:Uma2 family endonuclease
MTGGTIAADRVARRLLRALDRRLKPPCEAFGESVKVLVPTGRVRYPDVRVACGDFDPASDYVDPVVVATLASGLCLERGCSTPSPASQHQAN